MNSSPLVLRVCLSISINPREMPHVLVGTFGMTLDSGCMLDTTLQSLADLALGVIGNMPEFQLLPPPRTAQGPEKCRWRSAWLTPCERFWLIHAEQVAVRPQQQNFNLTDSTRVSQTQAGKEVKRIKHIINLHPRSLEIDSAEVGLWDQARQPQHLPPENCSLKLWQAFCDPPPLIPIVPLGWSASLLGHVANIGKQAIQPWNFTILKRKYWLVDWQVSRAATFQLAPNKFFEGRQGQKQQLEQSCIEHLSGLAISSPQQKKNTTKKNRVAKSNQDKTPEDRMSLPLKECFVLIKRDLPIPSKWRKPSLHTCSPQLRILPRNGIPKGPKIL